MCLPATFSDTHCGSSLTWFSRPNAKLAVQNDFVAIPTLWKPACWGSCVHQLELQAEKEDHRAPAIKVAGERWEEQGFAVQM